jgi:hypothetical protein
VRVVCAITPHTRLMCAQCVPDYRCGHCGVDGVCVQQVRVCVRVSCVTLRAQYTIEAAPATLIVTLKRFLQTGVGNRIILT